MCVSILTIVVRAMLYTSACIESHTTLYSAHLSLLLLITDTIRLSAILSNIFPGI